MAETNASNLSPMSTPTTSTSAAALIPSPSSSAMKKSRKSNFSTDEVEVLVDSVRSYYGVLYGKHAKRATNRWVRQKAWMDILKQVNGVSVEKRTLQEVKNKWKKCQYAIKEKAVYEAMDQDGGADNDSSWEDVDSMPLQERLASKADKPATPATATTTTSLRSQPLSPTKIKVTRQAIKQHQVHHNTTSTKAAESTPKPAESKTSQHEHTKPPPLHYPPPPSSDNNANNNEEMCLRWNSHHSNMQTAFPHLLSKEQYVDVTLAAEGRTLKCHRLILSSCSPYFDEILASIGPHQHPVLFLRDIPFWILKCLCDFMYAGEVHICQNRLEELLSVAEALKIKGLARKSTINDNSNSQQQTEDNSDKRKEKKQSVSQQQQQQQYQQHKKKATRQLSPQPTIRQKQQTHEVHEEEDDDDLLDPLDLLEPLYEEIPIRPLLKTSMTIGHHRFHTQQPPRPLVTQPTHQHYQRKPFGRRMRKRKYAEVREPSPPPIFSFRKGTRSRPNVKVPKYYDSDYHNALSTNPPKLVPIMATNNVNVGAISDPLVMEVDEIKTEPIDVEDNSLGVYNNDDVNDRSGDVNDRSGGVNDRSGDINDRSGDINDTSGHRLGEAYDKSSAKNVIKTSGDEFKRIKLTRQPVITDVHTIEEPSPPIEGGLEVIKLNQAGLEVNCAETNEDGVEGDARLVVIETFELQQAVEETNEETGEDESQETNEVTVDETNEVKGDEINEETEEFVQETYEERGDTVQKTNELVQATNENTPETNDEDAHETNEEEINDRTEETNQLEPETSEITQETNDFAQEINDFAQEINDFAQETNEEHVNNNTAGEPNADQVGGEVDEESQEMSEVGVENVEPVKSSVLDQLEKEAMNVANAINMETRSSSSAN